jgi:hypothetical protein
MNFRELRNAVGSLDFDCDLVGYGNPHFFKSWTGKVVIFGSVNQKSKRTRYNVVILLDPQYVQSACRMDYNTLETKIYQQLTTQIIEANVSPHIAGVLAYKTCPDILRALPKHVLTQSELLKSKANPYETMLHQLRFDHTKGMLRGGFSYLVLEQCSFCAGYLADELIRPKLFKAHADMVVAIMRRMLFQIVFTLASTQKTFNNFNHNDLFLRNILYELVETTDKKKRSQAFIEYDFDGNKFYLPYFGICAKIIDFGLSTLGDMVPINFQEIQSGQYRVVNRQFAHKNNRNDLFVLLNELYNGRVTTSEFVGFRSIIDNKSMPLSGRKALRTLFGSFWNVNAIEKIDIDRMRKVNNITDIDILQQMICDPADYLTRQKTSGWKSPIDPFQNYRVPPKHPQVIVQKFSCPSNIRDGFSQL